MMRVQVDAPMWARFRVLAWACRMLGLARRWEASGRDLSALLLDLNRLGREQGFTVEVTGNGTFSFTFPGGQSFAVTCTP